MIRFRIITEADLSFLNEVRNDCVEYLHDSRTFTLEETKEWFRSKRPKYWIIWKGEIRIGYFRTSKYENRSIYVGADLHKDYQGKGLGYESYVKFLPFIFNYFDIDTVKLEVFESNNRAINLYKKLGFIETDRFLVPKNNGWAKSIQMSITLDQIL